MNNRIKSQILLTLIIIVMVSSYSSALSLNSSSTGVNIENFDTNAKMDEFKTTVNGWDFIINTLPDINVPLGRTDHMSNRFFYS